MNPEEQSAARPNDPMPPETPSMPPGRPGEGVVEGYGWRRTLARPPVATSHDRPAVPAAKDWQTFIQKPETEPGVNPGVQKR